MKIETFTRQWQAGDARTFAVLMLMFISQNGITAPVIIHMYNQQLRSISDCQLLTKVIHFRLCEFTSYSISVCAKVMTWHHRH